MQKLEQKLVLVIIVVTALPHTSQTARGMKESRGEIAMFWPLCSPCHLLSKSPCHPVCLDMPLLKVDSWFWLVKAPCICLWGSWLYHVWVCPHSAWSELCRGLPCTQACLSCGEQRNRDLKIKIQYFWVPHLSIIQYFPAHEGEHTKCCADGAGELEA